MKCTECGSEFYPRNDEEDICEDCQLEQVMENTPELLGEQEYSEEMHRRNNPHYFPDPEFSDHDDFRDPEDNYEEPCGSCDECGCNLYPEDAYDGLCSQCAWYAEQGEGSPDVGGSGIISMD